VDIFTSTPAKQLVMKDGAIASVIAEDSDGNTMHIAAKAVILASGGFGNNPDLVEKYSWFKRTAHDMMQAVPTENTGDGLRMALEAGADTESLGAVMIIACARGKTLTSHVSGAGSQPVLWVNKTGRRFADEKVAMSFADCGNTIAKQPGSTAYSIIDSATVAHLMEDGSDIGLGDFIEYHMKLTRLQAELDQDVADGIAWKGETIEELAAAMGLDPAVLGETVAEDNEACDNGYDPQFFKPATFLRPVRQAPFYAINMAASVLVSCGGIRVNGNLQVTDRQYEPIPGLYAVGMEASGLYGDTYNLDVPGTANGFAHASGRVAARHVVATLKGAPELASV
jgi:fumarate reductase flavoprotein subunit